MTMRCITTVDARFLCDMLSLLYYKHLTADDLSSVAWRTALRYFFAEKKRQRQVVCGEETVHM